MATSSKQIVPARAIHPGEVLREELLERGIKQKDFAQMIGVQATHLNEFIKGKRNLNEELAMKLEKALGISYKNWMNLQSGYIYDCQAIEERRDEEQRALRFEKACSDMFNLNLLYKRLGMSLMPCAERVEKIKGMVSFDLLSAEELKMQVAGLYKHSERAGIDEKNMLTWLILNNISISRAPALPTSYEKGNALKAAAEIAAMANRRELTMASIKECLNRQGILYVEVAKLDKAPIDAFSTMRGETPVVSVTYRYNDMDKLAFDLLHELCHIDRHLTKGQAAFISVDGGEGYSSDPREKEANEFARQALIPDSVWEEIMKVGCKSLSPFKIVKTIAVAAKSRGISPSIAVARYKHDTNWYNTAAYRSPRIA